MSARRKRDRTVEMFSRPKETPETTTEAAADDVPPKDDAPSAPAKDAVEEGASKKKEFFSKSKPVAEEKPVVSEKPIASEKPVASKAPDDTKPALSEKPGENKPALEEKPLSIKVDSDVKLADFDYHDPMFGGALSADENRGPAGYYGTMYGLEDNAIGEGADGIEIEFAEDYSVLPAPEVFNAYPPEVQRKIMEWRDRDVRARRDDESRRRDELMRAKVEQERRSQVLPVIVIVFAIICGTVSGIATGNPLFPIAFLIVPLAVIGARLAGGARKNSSRDKYRKPPQ